ncbi:MULTISPECIES: helix-turn-helix transcriptional regulator [Asticcacaulis]|uniref:ArsR/SmtB family transcription factor n=1 Tax=Asticcacaulis TaxID=76890 RepID=UPI001AE2635C|nr:MULTISPECIES: metalloregulator ArsR/SmtB family transcription factor [Asticcacaulis]MBP2160319.1 DNA-binding transcriptional ArsR family regulator [Asticcacaulis solisilvae]MDR6801378.1 DNA-binding transcriptional ArsR family regulator [Asticcacaulis sp. BE141]
MDKHSSLQAFDALSQETRLDALRLLIQAGPEGLPAGEIAERLGIRQNTMSVNLKILAQARLITSVREGRIIRYAANYAAIQGLILFLMQDCCGGRKELCQPVLDQVRCC